MLLDHLQIVYKECVIIHKWAYSLQDTSGLMLSYSSSFLSNYIHIVGQLQFRSSLSVIDRVFELQIQHFHQINLNQH